MQINNFLFQYIIKHKFYVWLAAIAVLVATAIILSIGFILRNFVDVKNVAHNSIAFVSPIIFLLILSGILAIAVYFRLKATATLAENVTQNIRYDIFQHIINLTIPFIEQVKVGDLLTIIDYNCEQIYSFISKSAAVALRTTIQLVVGLVLLLITSAKLFALLSIIIPCIIIPIKILSKKVKYYNKKVNNTLGNMLSFAEERINSLSILKSLNAEANTVQQFKQLLDERKPIIKPLLHYRALLVSIVISTSLIAVILVVYIGSKQVIYNTISPGQLIAFIFYATIVAVSISNIADIIGDYNAVLVAGEKLLELFKAPIEKNNYLTQDSVIAAIKEIKFDNVTFSYPQRSSNLVLNKLSFTIQANEKVAIVGQSGVGKSTILKLLLGYYNNYSGNIYINDIELSKYYLATLRSFFAFIPQDSKIFNTTIANNIAIGSNKIVTEDVCKKIANQAHITDFSDCFPQKLNTVVGEKGEQLSGGQKQRVSLARAILRNSSCYFLDEATNSLDSKNEQLIQQVLDKLLHNKTAIIIAHRLSTVKNVDKIIVISSLGTLEAVGTHAELMQKSLLYKSLANTQILA